MFRGIHTATLLCIVVCSSCSRWHQFISNIEINRRVIIIVIQYWNVLFLYPEYIYYTIYIVHLSSSKKKLLYLYLPFFLMKMLWKAVHLICVTFYSTSCYREKISITFYLKLETCYWETNKKKYSVFHGKNQACVNRYQT